MDNQVDRKNARLLDQLKAEYQEARRRPRNCRHCARNNEDIDSLVCGTCGPEKRYFLPKVRK